MRTLDEVAEFHGHVCPGLALGYRVSLRALKEFGDRAMDEEIVAVVENDSCAVDAIQVMTACTFGKGNLIHRDYGKQVYTFFKRDGNESIRIAVTWTPPADTPEQLEAWTKYAKGDRSKEVAALVHDRKASKISSIMEASDEDLLSVTREAKAQLPPVARIHQSLRCGRCGEKVMETRARLYDNATLCIPCFESALGGRQ